MQEVYEYLKKCGTYYLATMDGDQPRVRPFGTIDLYDGGLYIQTGRIKDVSKQIAANPKIEICACAGADWVRIAATAVDDPRIEAIEHMLDAYPSLRGRYKSDDGNTQVFRLTNVTATFSSFTDEPRTVTF